MAMGDFTRLTGIFAVVCPPTVCLVWFLLNRIGAYGKDVTHGRVPGNRPKGFLPDRAKLIVPVGYLLLILVVTLLRKTPGTEHRANMMPFWTYRFFSRLDIRWQAYMNVFLFIPFGFFLPWSTGCSLLVTVAAGAVLSCGIEWVQYAFCLGLCETDDIIHNTLGALIGCGYWQAVQRMCQAVCRINQNLEG